MTWTDYIRTAERSSAPPIPQVDDDLYDAVIVAVGEPKEAEDIYNPGSTRVTFWIDWELRSGDVAEGTQLRQWIALPPGYIEDGFLSEKSRLFQVMEALGFDMDGPIHVSPPDWVGLPARIMVENKLHQASGEMRPRITGVKPARRQQAGQAPQPAQPAQRPQARPAAAQAAPRTQGKPQQAAAKRSDPYADQPEDLPWE